MNNLIIKTETGAILSPETSQKIAEFERQTKAIKEAEDKLKAQILAEMEAQNVKKLDTDDLTISYFEPSYSETFDSKKLKEEDEATYNKYIKITPKKSYIKIKVK